MTIGSVRSRRLILKKNEPVQLVQAFAKAAGWELVGVIERDPEQAVNYEARWDVDATTSVHYIIDDTGIDDSGQLRFMVVHGEDRAQLAQVLGLLEKGLDVWSQQELVKVADLSFGSSLPEEQVRAMVRLGLGAPLSATKRVKELLVRGSEDAEPIVRYATLWAIAHAEWPECVDVVRNLTHDGHPDVAALAEDVLQVFGAGHR